MQADIFNVDNIPDKFYYNVQTEMMDVNGTHSVTLTPSQ
jgi:hypothetical protein